MASICGHQAASMGVGNGWEVVEKYIQIQDKHDAKTTAMGLVHAIGQQNSDMGI